MPPAGGRTTPPVFFPEKENGRCDRPKERRLIGSPKLEQPLCLRNATACVRRSRVSFARRFASASTTRCCAAVGSSAALRMRHTPCGCRSAYLVGVQTNHRLPPVSTMRRALAMPHSVVSLPPSKRHSRLTIVRRGCKTVTIRRDSWRSHVHRTYIAQRVQPFKLQTVNVGGRGALPSPFSGGFKGGILFGKRIPPLVPRRARRSPSRARAGKSRHPFGKGCKKDPPQLWQVFF